MNPKKFLRDHQSAAWAAVILAAVLIWGIADGTIRDIYSWAAFGTLLVVFLVILHFSKGGVPSFSPRALWQVFGTGVALVFVAVLWLFGSMLLTPKATPDWHAAVSLMPSVMICVAGIGLISFAAAMSVFRVWNRRQNLN
jgi:hypothetical protein